MSTLRPACMVRVAPAVVIANAGIVVTLEDGKPA